MLTNIEIKRKGVYRDKYDRTLEGVGYTCKLAGTVLIEALHVRISFLVAILCTLCIDYSCVASTFLRG